MIPKERPISIALTDEFIKMLELAQKRLGYKNRSEFVRECIITFLTNKLKGED